MLCRLLRRDSSLHSFAKAKAFSSTGSKGGGFSFPAPRKLNEIVKTEDLLKEDAQEIKRIWMEYHDEKSDCLAASITMEQHEMLLARGKDCPFFIFPIYRGEGFFNMITQFQDSCFLVTYLEAYKENPAQAPPCLTVSIFGDLVKSKQLGLIRVDIANMLDKQVRLMLCDLYIIF